MPNPLPPNPAHEAPIQPLYGPPNNVAEPVAYEQPVRPQAVAAAAPQPVSPPAVPPPQAPVQPTAASLVEQKVETMVPQITLVSHSSLFYWWPVWAVGYACALITYYEGQAVQLGSYTVNFHTTNNPGVLFFLTLFVVILISNVVVRGLASALVIMGMVLCTVVFAYFGWWDAILGWFGELTIFLNQGAYFWFSTLMFLVWGFTTFVFDRMSYWRVVPGQMTHVAVFGASSRSYDTENMTFEKQRNDVFRHWLLGVGSGDLTVNTFNAGRPEEVKIPNVLFIGSKIQAIQRMIAAKPE